MTKYTIEIHHVEGSWFEPITTLHNVTYFNLLEIYGLICSLKYPTKKILVQTQINQNSTIHIEELITSKTAEKLIREL